jgi:hypothetical protein
MCQFASSTSVTTCAIVLYVKIGCARSPCMFACVQRLHAGPGVPVSLAGFNTDCVACVGSSKLQQTGRMSARHTACKFEIMSSQGPSRVLLACKKSERDGLSTPLKKTEPKTGFEGHTLE